MLNLKAPPKDAMLPAHLAPPRTYKKLSTIPVDIDLKKHKNTSISSIFQGRGQTRPSRDKWVESYRASTFEQREVVGYIA